MKAEVDVDGILHISQDFEEREVNTEWDPDKWDRITITADKDVEGGYSDIIQERIRSRDPLPDFTA
jgi:hypothetical protein